MALMKKSFLTQQKVKHKNHKPNDKNIEYKEQFNILLFV